jgi:5-hydroxyisourate hydrolase
MTDGRLTTHVLDTTHGRPARGMRIDLLYVHGDHTHHIARNLHQCRWPAGPAAAGRRADFQLGEFELHFHVGQYFSRLGLEIETPFLDVVPIRFTLSEKTHYHVPLLVSPFGYSTYRGS